MRFAQFISIFGHPLFMPVYAMLLIFEFNPYINLQIPKSVQVIVLTILSIFTILLPLLTAIILHKLGLVKSIYMKTAEERKWPFLLSVLWYYLGFELLTNISLPASLYLLMIGAITVILIAHFITLRWKISVHMLAIGGVIGAMIGLSQRFQFNHFYVILVLFFVAGLIGYARLKTNSHNYRQVYAGFVLGIMIEWIAVSLL
tara:strand:+ start:186 stop:791 length:606 start_codon:yes stop_codon:yes gene_type:complete